MSSSLARCCHFAGATTAAVGLTFFLVPTGRDVSVRHLSSADRMAASTSGRTPLMASTKLYLGECGAKFAGFSARGWGRRSLAG